MPVILLPHVLKNKISHSLPGSLFTGLLTKLLNKAIGSCARLFVWEYSGVIIVHHYRNVFISKLKRQPD